MIKFFRHIRKKLLAENKFSKYLAYALGEIILVIIGILIALQVNNYNIQKKENQKFITDLSKVVIDLNNDYTQLDSLIYIRQTDLEYSQLLIDTYLEKQPISMETFFKGIRQVTLEHRFTQNTQGLSLIKEAKLYDSNEFKKIRILIENYGKSVENFTYIEERLNIVTEQLELELLNKGQIQPLYAELYYLKKGEPKTPYTEHHIKWTQWIESSVPFKGLIHRVEDDIQDKILPQYLSSQDKITHLMTEIENYLKQINIYD